MVGRCWWGEDLWVPSRNYKKQVLRLRYASLRMTSGMGNGGSWFPTLSTGRSRKDGARGVLRMRRVLGLGLAVVLLAWPHGTWTQTADDAGAKNAKQAKAVLDAMVQAL